MLCLEAEFLLGTYGGRTPAGEPELFPSPLRLHSALLAAAGSSPAAQEQDGCLVPRPEHVELLEWFEAHPPDRIWVPQCLCGTGQQALLYKQEGLRRKSKPAPPAGVQRVAPSVLDGPIVWGWLGFPTEFDDLLEELLAEVTHLGPADSAVALSRVEAPSDDPLERLPDDPFKRSGLRRRFQVPGTGRTHALITAHVDQLVKPKKDGLAKDEDSRIDPMVASGVAYATYGRPTAQRAAADLPWSELRVAQFTVEGGELPDPLWGARALHRALISRLGAGGRPVDAWITGKYLKDVVRPANGLAIHCLPRTEDAALEWDAGTHGALIVMIPQNAPETVRDEVDRGLTGMTEVRLTRRSRLILKSPVSMSAADFWRPPESGVTRTWATWPAAVADRSAKSLEQVVRTSLGMVWRDRSDLPVESVRVVQGRSLTDRDPKRFVHRTQPGVLIRPYQAEIDMQGLLPSRSILAIGQSRHFGGGLLVPVDREVPAHG